MSLLPLMKMRLFSPEAVIDIGKIPGLDGIEDRGDHIAIGALVRHRDTAGSALVAQHGRALAEAAAWTGDTQVRNRGTTCGSMAHADISADQPAGALALGATMVAVSQSGTREIAAADFFVDTLTSALNADEILVEIRISKAGDGEGSAYDKLGEARRPLRLRGSRSRRLGAAQQRHGRRRADRPDGCRPEAFVGGGSDGRRHRQRRLTAMQWRLRRRGPWKG